MPEAKPQPSLPIRKTNVEYEFVGNLRCSVCGDRVDPKRHKTAVFAWGPSATVPNEDPCLFGGIFLCDAHDATLGEVYFAFANFGKGLHEYIEEQTRALKLDEAAAWEGLASDASASEEPEADEPDA